MEKIIKNRNELWYLIFSVLALSIVIIGFSIIINILFPPIKFTINTTGILLLCLLMISFSFIIHGFHPILLVKK